MKISLCLFLLFSALDSKVKKISPHPIEIYIGDPKAREIYLNFRKKFPAREIKVNEHILWLYEYGIKRDFPYFQSLTLEVANNFPISSLKSDIKVIERINLFYETIWEDGETILNVFLRGIDITVAEYLVESGFPIRDYSFDELRDMLPKPKSFGIEYGQLPTNPEFYNLLANWPKVIYHLNSYDLMVEVYHLFKEGKPYNLIVDMLKMKIKELKAFSGLPVMRDDKTRSILRPLFKQCKQFREMFNTFKILSQYPEAIECLGLVQGPDINQRQKLIILFPHHVKRSACDEIASLDLREKIGGWGQNVFDRQREYLAILNPHDFIAKQILNIEDNGFRDRMIVDRLWTAAHWNNPNSLDTLMKGAREIVPLIVNEESQGRIYQMLGFRPGSPVVQYYKDDELIWELERGHWDGVMADQQEFGGTEVNLLLFLLIPQLFPKQMSRIALSVYLDSHRYVTDNLYVHSILQEYLSGDKQLLMKNYTIEGLQQIFKVEIDPSILDDLNCSSFKEFAISAYGKIRRANVQPINVEKLINLLSKQEAPLAKKIILEEIISRIIIEPKNEIIIRSINQLIYASHDRKVSFSKLGEEVKDVWGWLNFLYSMFEPVSFFRAVMNALEESVTGQLRSNLKLISTSDSFGHDFLNDIGAILALDVGHLR